MSAPLPFLVSQQIGNKFAQGSTKRKDISAIDEILSHANKSGKQEDIDLAMRQILSKVSPERQQNAMALLQNKQQRIEADIAERKGKQAAKEAGYTYGVPANVAAEQVKATAKSKRINDAGFNNTQPQRETSPKGQLGQPSPRTNNAISNLGTREDFLLNLTGHPDKEISDRAKEELKVIRSAQDNERADLRDLRKETLPLKQQIIERADASRESIRNKSHLLDIIDRGEIDDPTFAIFAESLPFNLGKRMLSEDTVEYKGGLVDEFSDLKNIFKGATRVKEVEIYENKLADLYLTDSQKKAILKSRINTAKIDLLREEAAAEVEEKHPNLTALQFNKKVEEIAKPKINSLFNAVWDEQKAVFDQAEARKELPLDLNDPQDKEIIKQILLEAGGNYIEAEKLAKKKGYKF